MNTKYEHQVWAPSLSTKHEHWVSFEWASLINGQLWPYGIHFPNGFFLSGYVVMTEQSLTWRHVMRCDLWCCPHVKICQQESGHQYTLTHIKKYNNNRRALWKKNALKIIHFQRIFMSLTLLTVYTCENYRYFECCVIRFGPLGQCYGPI